MKIIGLTGQARAGKDTVARYIKQYCADKALICATYAFADPIYDMIQALLGAKSSDFPHGRNVGLYSPDRPSVYADKEKVIPGLGVSIRTLAETLGTEWGRQVIGPNIWTDMAHRWLEYRVKGLVDVMIFTDIRYQNEADFVKKEGGKIIEVSVPQDQPASKPRQCVGGVDGHSSKNGIAPAQCDAFIVNRSTLDALRADAEYAFHSLTGV